MSGKPPKKKITSASLRRAFATLLWPRRKLLLLGLFLILINRAAGLVLPGSTKFLIDRVIGQGDLAMLKLLLSAVGGAVAVQAVTSFILTRLLSVEAQGLISRLRANVQKHMLRLPISHFDRHASGALVSRVMNDVEGVRNLVGTGLLQLAGGVLTSAASLFLLLRISPLLTGLTLLPMILFSLISFRAFAYLRPTFRARGVITAEVTGRLTETLNGIRVIKGFNAEAREEKTFEDGVGRLFENVKKTLTATSLVTGGATLLMGLASIVIMGVGGHRIITGGMTLGDFFSFTLYVGFLVAPVVQMSNIGSQLTEAFAGLDRMEETLSLPREGDDPARTVALRDIEGDMEFENVIFSYEAGKPVIHGVSFKAPAGTVTALVGSSGSGKTTIAGLAASFLTPDQGRVVIDGVDLSRVKVNGFRSRLAVVLQNDFLFDGTLRDNIMFGNPRATASNLNRAVEAAHVREFCESFDKGLDTVIGERGVRLSGGQRQRVSLARAILADPKILILDEATSNLDMESEAYIQESLSGFLKGRTTFVIAHRLSTIRRADQILVVEKGRVEERGTHQALIDRRGRYHQLYMYQTKV